MHWAEQYIGRPWVSGARGPLAFDCWGLLYWVYRHHYGIELPEFVGIDANDHLSVLRVMREQAREHDNGRSWGTWQRTASPGDGDAVAMAHADSFSHVGLWLCLPEGGSVLHCAAGSGVALMSLQQLSQLGFSNVQFYHHAAHC